MTTTALVKNPLPALTRQPIVLVGQPVVLVGQVQAVFAVRAGQPARCCVFLVFGLFFWCYTKQTQQQQQKTPFVFLLRWFFGALSSSSLVL